MPSDAFVSLDAPSSTDPLDRDAARRDLWPRATLEMRDGRLPPSPDAVVWPRNADEVAQVLAAAARSSAPVVAYGAGSGVCGGAAGLEGAWVVDLKRMNRLMAIDPDRGVAWAQPGLLGQHFEDLLAREGWRSAHSPSSIACSTVGGWAAARGAGQFSSRYGVFDDMLLAASAEAPTGRVRAGAWCLPGESDPLPLLCGSEGTLAVLTDLAVRVVPIAPRRWLRGYALPSLEAAWDTMRRLMQLEVEPFVLRLYDPIDTRIGGPARAAKRSKKAHAPAGRQLVERLRSAVESVPALREHLLELPLALPRLVNRLADSLGDEVLLVVGWEGDDAAVSAAVADATPALASARDLGPDPGEHWYAHRHDVSYKLAPVFAGGGWADTMEVASTWSRLPALHDAVRAALGERTLVMAHFSHAYREGCSIYFSFAGRGGVETYDATWQAGLAAAREAGGTVTHHHGVGQLKATAAAREAGAALRIWREAKDALDPTGLLNPGRLFDRSVPERPGPPPPDGAGPVFALSALDRLAEIDPNAPLDRIHAALAAEGHRLRLLPDRPLLAWLRAWRRGHLPATEQPYFTVQARFADGVSARVGPAPRSAAGPDLRPGLIEAAQVESVTVAVLPASASGGPVPPAPTAPACLPPDPLAWSR